MKIENLSQEKFKPYGSIIDFGPAKDDGWEIIVTAQSPGWRIALLEFERKEATRLEHHPLSKESFEPVSGVSILLTAEFSSPDNIKGWLLDRPVCLHEKVWHEVFSLSSKSVVKITENADVECVYHQLSSPLGAKIL